VTSFVSHIVFAIADIHCCFSSRPVTTGGAGGVKPPLENFSPPPGKMYWTSCKLIGYSSKIWAPLRKSFASPGVPSWLRACSQVTQSVTLCVLPKSKCFWYNVTLHRSGWDNLLLATKLFYSVIRQSLWKRCSKLNKLQIWTFFTGVHKRA